MLARKGVTQRFKPTPEILSLMRDFKSMMNIAIEIGLRNNVTTRNQLSKLTYHQLKDFKVPSGYKLAAMNKARGILSARRKSIRRGYPTKIPYQKTPMLRAGYGFFKIKDGKLRVTLTERNYFYIPLNNHTFKFLSQPGVNVRSFTLNERILNISVSKEVEEIKPASMIGVDRNLRNLTIGNVEQIKYYDMSKVVQIAETTRSVYHSFKRNDSRIKKQIYSKYGKRSSNRRMQILHSISKQVVANAVKNRQGIVFENIKDVRRMFQKGTGHSRNHRSRMNSWPYFEIKRQIEYKANWAGVPVIRLTVSETRGTSKTCPRCRERLEGSKELERKLWCRNCRELFDRDYVAVVNIARRGWTRFAQSKGEAVEAMVGVFKPTVDASKSSSRQPPIT